MIIPIQDQIKNAIEDANPKVIFSVSRTSGNVNAKTAIFFSEANVNEGGGIDTGSGRFTGFTVPVSGIYSFSFRGVSSIDTEDSVRRGIEVRKNNTKQFRISEPKSERDEILSATWIMNLSRNDVISIYAAEGGFYGSPINPILFNGHLLMKQ